jgi:hypothetical protein
VLKVKVEEKEKFIALLTDCVIHRRFNMACNRMLKYGRALTRQMYVSYAVGHEQMSSHLFRESLPILDM